MQDYISSLVQSINWQNDPYHLVLAWAAVMCVLLFFMMGLDKSRARNGRWRIPEKTLFLFALLGGALGGWLGMKAFHHKTHHWYFRILFPFIVLIWTAGLLWVRNRFPV